MRFIQDGEGIVQGAAAHKGQWSYFDGAVFEECQQSLRRQHITEGIIERLKIGVELLFEVAGKKSEILTGLHCWSRKDDLLYLFVFQSSDGQCHGSIGLAGSGRTDGYHQVVPVDGLNHLPLVGCPGPDQQPVTAVNQYSGMMPLRLQRDLSILSSQDVGDIPLGKAAEVFIVK